MYPFMRFENASSMRPLCVALGIMFLGEDSIENSSAYLFKPCDRLSLKVHKRECIVGSDFNFFYLEMFEFLSFV